VADVYALFDDVVAACLIPVAIWILVSGLDDLFVLAVYLRRGRKSDSPLPTVRHPSEKRIGVVVPCWQEAEVIAEMVDHNVSAIRYSNYEILIGGYPNDEQTLNAVRSLENRYRHVHLYVCPHGGPTSKADCLNWIYQQLLLSEQESGKRFDLVVTHDAEDLIHPDELALMNRYTVAFDMVQTPVLPLATPFKKLTHGLYCDDFAEGHTKDLVARQALGGFIPSCGVGTAYTRQALETLAASESNRVFEPSCLTEDYENGLRLHRLGLKQAFVPLTFRATGPVATREYFPQNFWDAVKQRTRWVTGISLQSWERHGWSGNLRQAYWMWRDRKGLIGSPVGLLANLITLYAVFHWPVAGGGLPGGAGTAYLLGANLVLLLTHLAVRMACTAETYGIPFALGVPVRSVYGNVLNTVAVVRAVFGYLRARMAGRPLVWVKTEHAYPSRAGLLPHKKPLEEILLASRYLTVAELNIARETLPAGARLVEHLVSSGILAEEELYEALSLQLGLSLERLEPNEVRQNIARSLPARVVREWNVLPVRIESGRLHLASPDIPTDALEAELRRFTRLDIKVQLVTPANFQRLADALL
jgi:bacteriophage N4 adsorption protein B